MPKHPRVSVVMTTYNAGRFVRETINSILSQTFTDFEFIIVDDCSTDNTVSIIESFCDPRIRLIRNSENKGISATRNIGIDAARGDYLAALDHDDISLPERLAHQVAFLDSHPRTVLVGTAAKLLENGRIRDYYDPITEPHLLRWSLFTRCPLIHSSICMRVKTLRDHGLYYRQEYHYAEDFDLYHRLAEIGDLACLPDRLIIYREHGDNTSARHAEAMARHGQLFMLDAYRRLLGSDIAPDEMPCIWNLMVNGAAATHRSEIDIAGVFLTRLLTAFLEQVPLDPAQADDIRRAASRTWWLLVQRSAKHLGLGALSVFSAYPALTSARPALHERAKACVSAVLGPKIITMIQKSTSRIFSIL